MAYTSFHQQEDLTTRLKNILHEYPAGVGIFKEFLQNADDAGARRFAVCYDGRAHQSTGLFDEALAPWQGPALLCFNDAIFSDSDFESISHVGQSTKAADLSTIGKYGLGFNCAYHFTDVVQFITGDDFVCFDPHGRQDPAPARWRRRA